jgi:hypothetical protein
MATTRALDHRLSLSRTAAFVPKPMARSAGRCPSVRADKAGGKTGRKSTSFLIIGRQSKGNLGRPAPTTNGIAIKSDHRKRRRRRGLAADKLLMLLAQLYHGGFMANGVRVRIQRFGSRSSG